MEFCQRLKIQKAYSLVTFTMIRSCDNIYNSKSSLTKNGKGIGYGKKSDFTKDLTCSPGSSKYRLDTLFDRNRKSKKGFSVGLSREVFVW